jgi:hypothetical protein
LIGMVNPWTHADGTQELERHVGRHDDAPRHLDVLAAALERDDAACRIAREIGEGWYIERMGELHRSMPADMTFEDPPVASGDFEK